MTTAEIYFTSDVLKVHPSAKDSTIRSLVRRKFVVPVKHGHQFLWTAEQIESIRGYFEGRVTPE
jgi:hypothetical protein